MESTLTNTHDTQLSSQLPLITSHAGLNLVQEVLQWRPNTINWIRFRISGLLLSLCVVWRPHRQLEKNLEPCVSPASTQATLAELAKGLENGHFTSEQLVKVYLLKIAEASSLNAVLEVNPDALEIAAILDKERALGEIHGPLHGIPILIKDNIATFDKMNNTAGSYALVGAKVPRDSPTVARLRAAGAIILGKTNLSSWAQYRSDNGSSGWSALGGQCYGARYPCQDPYGSSSGSGVAADAGLAWATLGTETHGSIIMPAQRANCVGIKPTVGLTSRHLVVPISSYQDTVGPIARTVRDAAAILAVIAGPDQWDKSTLGIPFKLLPDYMGATQSVNIAGFRIGIPRNGVQSKITWAPVNETLIMAHFETAAEVLRSLGAEIVDYTNFSDKLVKEHVSSEEDALSDFGKSHESITVASGFATDIASYFSELSHNPHKITNLKEMRDFTRSCPEEDYPNRDTGIWDSIIDQGFDSSDERAHTAHQASLALDNLGGVTGVLDKYGLDALILPSDYAPGWAAAPGLPVVTVPMGVYPMGTPVLKGKRELIAVAPGIPFGLSFMGRRWSEEVLIQLAYAFEQPSYQGRFQFLECKVN